MFVTSNVVFSRIAINEIVFATDFSSSSNRALPYALALATRSNARLVVAHVLPSGNSFAEEVGMPAQENDAARQRLEAEARENLATLCAANSFSTLIHHEIVGWGEVWSELCRIVQERNAGLVVLGTRGLSGLKKVRAGSTAEDVMRSIPCPVMIVGPNAGGFTAGRFRRILYATNFAKASLRALRYAIALKEEDQASLTMLHVAPRAAGGKESEIRQRYSRQLAAMLPGETGLSDKMHTAVEFGRPAEEIVRTAEVERADVIILGVHAAGRSSIFLPSTVHYVLSHAPCPVLATCAE